MEYDESHDHISPTMISQIINKRIIVAPLCWGLGHATRCVPIINQLLEQGNTVAIASDGEALSLLKREFPKLESFELPAYDINYRYHSMIINMIRQGPKILNAVYREKYTAKEIASDWNADILISDNRLGFRSKYTKNIYITHQLNIPHPSKLLSIISSRLHHHFIHKYDECWVPDDEGIGSLAGKMTAGDIKIQKHYIGIQSRFIKKEIDQDIDIAIILSGPEPQRSFLEVILLAKCSEFTDKKIVLVRGTENTTRLVVDHDQLTVYDLLTSLAINDILNRTKQVICRAGYSSIMDLVTLGKGAILIPTPGQYEQEYLAKELDGKFGFQGVEQEALESFLI